MIFADSKKLDKLIQRRINVVSPKLLAFPLASVKEVNRFNISNDISEEYKNSV